MPRNFSLSMVRVAGDHHSSGPWSLKERTDSEIGGGARGRKVSTRILGIGICLVGVLILAIGLIMGLEFPNYVQEQNKERQCIVNPDQEQYRSWLEGSQWSRKVRAYYWTLLNANDFIYNGKKPRFGQRGPYVYQQKEIRYDVTFAVTDVTFRLRNLYSFDQDETEHLCSSCQENDKLTILSPWYLQTVGQAGGEDALGVINMSNYTAKYLSESGLTYYEEGELIYASNMSYLGRYNSSIYLSDLPLVNFSFGAWLNSYNASYKTILPSDAPLTLSEVISLYKVLSNLTLLGGRALSGPDPPLQLKCENWAQTLCSNVSTRLKFVFNISDCGVIYVFHKCHSTIFSSQVRDILQQTFCPQNSVDACLNISSFSDDVLVAYESAITDFLSHVSNVVLHNYLQSRDMDVVVTRNQSQLALGYEVREDDVFRGFHKTGLLHASWVGEISGQHPVWKLYTCLEQRNTNNNMKVKEYNGFKTVPHGLLRDVRQRSITGFTDFVTSCPDLKTCQTCSQPGSSLNIFHEDLLRPVTYLLNTTMSVSGVRVFRYEMDQATLDNSNVFRTWEGLQEMSYANNYLSWASFPHEIGNDTSYLTVDKPSAPFNSFITIEPVTGRVWEKDFKIQWNVGVSKESGKFLNRNITVTERPLPVFWLEKIATISSDEISAYKHLITRLMSTSCGGVIGFSVVTVVVVIIGIVICLYPAKPNRVTPMIEEVSNYVANGRYV